MANGGVFIRPADDPTTRLAQGLSGIAASRRARESGEFEREKLQEEIRRTDVGLEGALGVANIGAESREAVANIAAEQQELNRETQLEVARINQQTESAIDNFKNELAVLRLNLDINKQAADNARDIRRLNTDIDTRDLEELRGNLAVGRPVKDIDGQEIIDATRYGAYTSKMGTRGRSIVEGLVQRAMDPSDYARSRDVLLEGIRRAIITPGALFDSPTLSSGEPNPAFNDARVYDASIRDAHDVFQESIGEYIMQGLRSEEERTADLSFRQEKADATQALNSQLSREREGENRPEDFFDPSFSGL